MHATVVVLLFRHKRMDIQKMIHTHMLTERYMRKTTTKPAQSELKHSQFIHTHLPRNLASNTNIPLGASASAECEPHM